jgi:hypothetical protein
MSELLHPGYHPDADQLSAFAEHALPEHERLFTLAHLADCSDCRQIVFLAQQAMQDEHPAPHATPSRTPWFKRWNLLSPAAAALTCGLLIMAFLHGRQPANPLQESALASKPPAPVPPPQTPLPQPAVVARVPSPKPLPTKALPSASLKPAPPPATIGTVSSVKGELLPSAPALRNLPLQGHNTFTLAQPPTGAIRAGSASAHEAIGGAASQGYPAPLQQASSQTGSPVTARPTQPATLPSQNQMPSQKAAAPPLPAVSQSNQSFIPQSTNQTVEVTNASPAIQTESAILTAGALDSAAASAQVIASPSLPSKRLAASRISNGFQTLAVDSAGDLFLSKDSGVHWQHIAQQWTGRAIKVTLTSPTAAKQLDTSKAAPGGAASSATNFGSVSAASSARKAGFELTTDTGTTWFSPDGLIWERK